MVRKVKKDIAVAKVEKGEFPSVIAGGDLEVQVAAAEMIRAACKKIGMGLEDYLLAIKNGLKATKSTIDKYGEEHLEDDHATRLKSSAMGLELEGYIKNKALVSDNSKHTHVTYSWQPVQIVNNSSESLLTPTRLE